MTAVIYGQQIKFRLHGIDAPEKSQAFGNASKRALSKLTMGKTVQIVSHGLDRYGRLIGDFAVDGSRVSVAMVRQGMAWHYFRYAAKDTDLATAQAEARKSKRGLWSDSAPVAPWDFRKTGL